MYCTSEDDDEEHCVCIIIVELCFEICFLCDDNMSLDIVAWRRIQFAGLNLFSSRDDDVLPIMIGLLSSFTVSPLIKVVFTFSRIKMSLN